MDMSKILIVFIIGIISLNILFADGITKKTFLVKGDLEVSPSLLLLCANGGSNIDVDDLDVDTEVNLASKLNDDTLYFLVQSSTGCSLKIYPGSGTNPLYQVSEKTAEAIKNILSTGVAVTANITSTDPTINFVVKITNSDTQDVLLETTITVPNPSAAGTLVSATNSKSILSYGSGSLPPCSAGNTSINQIILHNGILKKCQNGSWSAFGSGTGGSVSVDSIIGNLDNSIFKKKMNDNYNYYITLKEGFVNSSQIASNAVRLEHLDEDLISQLTSQIVDYDDLSADAVRQLKSADNLVNYIANTDEYSTFKDLNPESGENDVSFVPITYINSDGEDEVYFVRVYNPVVKPTLSFKNGLSSTHFFIKSAPISGSGFDYDYNIIYKGENNALARYTCKVVLHVKTCNGPGQYLYSPYCGGRGDRDYFKTYTDTFACGNATGTNGNYKYITRSFSTGSGTIETMAYGGGTNVLAHQFDRRSSNVRGGAPISLTIKIYTNSAANNPIYTYKKDGVLYLELQVAEVENNPRTEIDPGTISVLPTGTDINVSVNKLVARIKPFGTGYKSEGNSGSNQFNYKLYFKTIIDGDNLSPRNCASLNYTSGNNLEIEEQGEYEKTLRHLEIPTTVTNNNNTALTSSRRQMCVKLVISDIITGHSKTTYFSDDIEIG